MAGPIRQPIDIDSLTRYIDANVPVIKTPIKVLQFGYGQSNPTYLLTSPSTKQRYVLRKKPPGQLLSKTAHAVEREYRVIKALEGTGVPAPKVYCLCTDRNVVGTEFYIMEYLDGRIFADPTIPGVTPEERTEMWRSAVLTLAKLHALPLKGSTYDLSTYGPPTSFYPRQIKTLSTVSASQSKAVDIDSHEPVGPLPNFDGIIDFFRSNAPPDATTIIHGDYKLDNLIFHPTEPRVIGILDWELSTIGHPLSDLSNLTMPWVAAREGLGGLGEDDASAAREEREKFAAGRLPGLPGREQIWEWYREVTGVDVRATSDYGDAFTLFRTSVICQGIAARYALRQASSAKAHMYGKQFPKYAEAAWGIVSRRAGSKSKL